MVDFGQATYIDGTVIPGAELRRNTQRDAGDGSGVVRPGDLKITQMDVPGAGVKVAVGDVLVQSRAPGADRETYGLPLVTAQNYLGDAGAGLPGTGSSVPSGGRRDLVFVEILDPGLPTSYTPQVDWPAGESAKLSVIQNVPASTRTIADVPALANVTGYELALITYPASTATITNAMITDLRALQSPWSNVFQERVNAPASNADMSSATGVQWPPVGVWVNVPPQATHVWLRGEVSGAVAVSAASSGDLWLKLGSDISTAITPYNEQGAFGSRLSYPLGAEVAVPDALRGTSGQIWPMAKRNAGTGVLRSYWGTVLDLDLLWVEEAV